MVENRMCLSKFVPRRIFAEILQKLSQKERRVPLSTKKTYICLKDKTKCHGGIVDCKTKRLRF